jgi:hypothetical protein
VPRGGPAGPSIPSCRMEPNTRLKPCIMHLQQITATQMTEVCLLLLLLCQDLLGQ